VLVLAECQVKRRPGGRRLSDCSSYFARDLRDLHRKICNRLRNHNLQRLYPYRQAPFKMDTADMSIEHLQALLRGQVLLNPRYHHGLTFIAE
jgi:hypothetical protein